jgi:hypothetical protein
MTNEQALIALSKNRDEPDDLMSIAANRATDPKEAIRSWLGEPRYRRFAPDFVLQQIAKSARLFSADADEVDKWIGVSQTVYANCSVSIGDVGTRSGNW